MRSGLQARTFTLVSARATLEALRDRSSSELVRLAAKAHVMSERSAEGAAAIFARSRRGALRSRGNRSGIMAGRAGAATGLRGRAALLLTAAVRRTTAAVITVMTTVMTTTVTATAIVATAIATTAVAAMATMTGDGRIVTAQQGDAENREQDRDTKYKRAIHS